MDEGMVYLLFNAEGHKSPETYDSVYRIFWVSAPNLHYHQIDAFLISETLGSHHWVRYHRQPILENPSETRYHPEIHLDDFDMEVDGTWADGYQVHFHDRLIGINATLNYATTGSAAPLVYYNGRDLVTPTLIQRFYDLFNLPVTGQVETGGRSIPLLEGRGILEHGVGIFSTLNFLEWHWIDLQFPEGGVHLFAHPINFGRYKIISAGEGAAMFNGQWHHFLVNDFTITPSRYVFDETVNSLIPIAWHITAGAPSQPHRLSLNVERTVSLAWRTGTPTNEDLVVDYKLRAEGTWNGSPIKGKGTMEFLTHHPIESE